jgi:hypothetical protein
MRAGRAEVDEGQLLPVLLVSLVVDVIIVVEWDGVRTTGGGEEEEHGGEEERGWDEEHEGWKKEKGRRKEREVRRRELVR